MTTYVAFLRAINVGGRTVRMEALRALFEQFGLQQVETFIASGNVIFTSRSGEAALVRKIEQGLREGLGFEVDTFVRSVAELAQIAAHRPFDEAAMASAGALNIGFLAEPMAAPAVQTLMGLRSGIDDFHVHGREVWWRCAKKQSESTFSNVNFERACRLRTTFRGINTVRKLAARLVP
ncbi:DUF1697 domain-containing protein [Rhizobacter sp. P5_C2]